MNPPAGGNPSSNMEDYGRNIGGGNLASRRQKKGECPTCGTKTHKVNFFGKKTALTVEGQSLYGRCLICNPVEGYTRRPPDQLVVPRTLEVVERDEDEGTMVSGITLDYRLVQGARRFESGRDLDDEDDNTYNMEEFHRAPKVRPEPSVGTMDDFRPDRMPGMMGHPSRSSNRRLREPVSYPSDMDPNLRYRLDNEMGPDIVEEDYENYPSQRRENYMDRPGPPPRGGDRPGPPPRGGGGMERPFRPGPPMRRGAGMDEPNSNISQSMRDMPRRTTDDGRPMGPPRRDREFEFDSRDFGGGFDPRDRGYDRGDDFDHVPRPPQQTGLPDNENYLDVNSIDSPKPNRLQGGDNEDEPNKRGNRSPYEKKHVMRDVDGFHDDNKRLHRADNEDLESSRDWEMDDHLNYGRKPAGHRVGGDDHMDFMHPSYKHSGTQHAAYRRDGKYNGSDEDEDMKDSGPPIQIDEIRFDGADMNKDVPVHGQVDRNVSGMGVASKPPPPAHLNRDAGMARQIDDEFDRSFRSTHSKDRSQSEINFKPLPQDEIEDVPRRKSEGIMKIHSMKIAPGMEEALDDIPAIIDSLQRNAGDTKMRENSMKSLADFIKSYGQEAKRSIVQHNGIPTMVQSMWEDMSNVPVQTAAIELMFTLSASTDGIASNDVMTEINGEGAVDALLISMQTHSSVEVIQRAGCGALCCLAAASKDNRDINDGTLSGAVLCVVNAMDSHRTSLAVQEWGVRALYNQCVFSINADANKKAVTDNGYETTGGIEVVCRAMDIAKQELVTVEWACKLFWCLTASENVARSVSASTNALHAIVKAILFYHRTPDGGSLTEAAYGAIANLAKLVDENHEHICNAGVISAALSSLSYYSHKEGVNVEVCAVLANLAVSSDNKKAIMKAGGIKAILTAMGNFTNSTVMQEEALRALVCLCIESDEAKVNVASDDAIATIIKCLGEHTNSVSIQVMACGLLASLSAHSASVQAIISNGGVSAMNKSMSSHPKERQLQEVGCLAWRNVSSLGNIGELLNEDSVNALLGAMDAQPESDTVQINACCSLWNLSAKAGNEPGMIVAAGGIKSIVKAMQDHSDSGAVQEMACGALWSILFGSDDRKRSAVESGGIDAVKCVFWMHPNEPATLEKACGVLSSVSVSHAEAIASSEGLTAIVEAMRSNASNVAVLEFGCLVLRNMVLVNPEYGNDASGAIATIINGMKEHPDETSLQREACDALWAMAAQSETCKSKILALDGVTVVMSTLDHSGSMPDVQEAARGAFSQLAMTSYA